MERKVIKFNLFGAICIFAVIVVAIVLIVFFAVKSNLNKKNESDSNNNSQRTENAVENDDKNNQELPQKSEMDDLDKEFVEKIVVDNEEKEITMKMYVSDLGYKMKYDIDSFFVDSNENGVDEYKSQLTDKIYINVSKNDEEFTKKVEELINNTNQKKNGNNTYKLSDMSINHRLCFKEQFEEGNNISLIYYIEGINGFFTVECHCGKELRDSTLPTIEKMIESFEV